MKSGKSFVNQSLGSIVIISGQVLTDGVVWQAERRTLPLTGTGNAALLQLPLAAFFASRQCPGAAIHVATDWALQQVHSRRALA